MPSPLKYGAKCKGHPTMVKGIIFLPIYLHYYKRGGLKIRPSFEMPCLHGNTVRNISMQKWNIFFCIVVNYSGQRPGISLVTLYMARVDNVCSPEVEDKVKRIRKRVICQREHCCKLNVLS